MICAINSANYPLKIRLLYPIFCIVTFNNNYLCTTIKVSAKVNNSASKL
jgi:hypothetical protein